MKNRVTLGVFPQWLTPQFIQRSRWLGYFMAVLFVGMAAWARFLLEDLLHDRVPFASFFVAVALTAWFGGYGPCLLAVALGTVASWYFVLSAHPDLENIEPYKLLGMGAFVFTGIVIAAFSGQVRRALSKLQVAQKESETRANQTKGLMDAALESDRRFRGFAEHSDNVLWIIRGDRDELVYINPAFARVYGRTTDEVYKDFSKLADYVRPEDKARASVFWEKCRDGLTVEEFQIVRPDGSIAWIRRKGFPIPDEAGRLEYRAGISEEITEEKRLQAERDQLLESERSARQVAERSVRGKDEFLATLSHELRSPLNVILGWMQILRFNAPTQEVLNQGLETIERNSRAQARLIEDLLDMSSIVSGKLRLEVQTVDLVTLIRSSIESVLPAAGGKEIRIEQLLDPLAGPVKGDPNRLQQVFWNLLSNAVKFTPKGGKIQVHLERVNSHCEIGVSDTGCGITADFLPFVFDRFRQQDSGSARMQGGLGLGLAIVKQLVESHGGSVAVKSEGEGKGSKFIVCLPIAISAARSVDDILPLARSHSGLDLSLEGLKILVVDDDPDACFVLRRILEEQKAMVTTASSAATGLESLSADPPHLLISDVGMPGEDGYQFISRVRKLPAPINDIPAIAVTAFARPVDRIHAMQAGYSMHVAKPVNALELLTVIAKLRPSKR
jgi:PAS domain S-box-containing protein